MLRRTGLSEIPDAGKIMQSAGSKASKSSQVFDDIALRDQPRATFLLDTASGQPALAELAVKIFGNPFTGCCTGDLPSGTMGMTDLPDPGDPTKRPRLSLP